MSALHQCQVGEKQGWSDNRDRITVDLPHLPTSTYWWTYSDKTLQEPKIFSCTVRQMITLHILQYSYRLMKVSATVCCCIDCINCTAQRYWL